jgi:hypothetical protein
VELEKFVYPPYGTHLVEAYDGRFECAFVALHPFVRVPAALGWSVTRQYPDDAAIAAHGAKCTWAEVSLQTGLRSCAQINQALLTAIGSLNADLAEPAGRDALEKFVQREPVWMPAEGRFEPLLQADLLAAFEMAGQTELIYVPEFPQSDPVLRFSVRELRAGEAPFPGYGTLLAPDESFLFTVDWDSFFTLFYGPRALVERVTRARGIEGFYATANTDHAWFNYSMGCATVTLSPEHWPGT